ncbi:MAG: hypothetical protein ACRDRH_16115 [Pseudonocardia sp.]
MTATAATDSAWRSPPRSVLDGDQPYGSSIQYEWTPAYVIDQPGTYIRPAELPGGAWQATVDLVAAPDIAAPHHVRVRAVGTSIEMTVDGTVARYIIPATECGGVAIRAWGAPRIARDSGIG